VVAPPALEDSMRRRRLLGASGRPLNFTVRRHPEAQCHFDAPMETLFLTAGVAMLLHIALSTIARRGLASHPVIEAELFAVPNRWLAAPDLIQLLRVQYFLPFRALPKGSHVLKPWVRGTLLAARLSGLIFVCAILGFFVAAFIDAGR